MSSKNSEENDETEKVDATSRYTTNQDQNKTEKQEDSEEENKTVVSKKPQKQPDNDPEFAIPDVDADLIEAIQHIKKAKDKIRRFIKDDKLPIEDLVAFEDKIDDIVGVELDSFVSFVATSYLKTKDKYLLKWDELWKILVQEWPLWEQKKRSEYKVDDWMQDGEEYDEFGEDGILNEEDYETESKHQARERVKHILRAKLDRYADKVDHIFKTHWDNILHSDTDSDNDETKKNVSKSKDQTEANKEDDSKTDRNTDADKLEESKDDNVSETTKNNNQGKESILRSSKMMEDHDPSNQVYQVRISKLNKVIRDLGYLLGLVFTTYDNYINGNYDENRSDRSIISKIKAYWWKHLHLQECADMVQKGIAKSPGVSILKSSTSKPLTGRPGTGASAQSKSSDITKTVTKTEAADKADKIDNNSDNERNAADYPNTSKTTKPGSATKIKFEDEAYKAEKADKMLDASLFVGFLADFFDESDDAMLVTSDDNDRGKRLADAFA